MRITVVLFFLLNTFFVNASERDINRLVLSDVLSSHIPALAALKYSLEDIYSELGVDVEWIKLPTERALKYSSEGRFDGEFIRAPEVAGTFEQLVSVPTPLFNVDLNFYCVRKKDCQNEINSKLVVGYNIEVKIYKQLCQELNLTCLPFYPYDNFLKPLIEDKVDVYLAAEIEIVNQIGVNTPLLYRSKSIKNFDVFHYLHISKKSLIKPFDKEFVKRKLDGRIPDYKQVIHQAITNTGKVIDVN